MFNKQCLYVLSTWM